jgi:hypothetical protein
VEAAEVVLDSVQRDEREREERDIEENAAGTANEQETQHQQAQDRSGHRSSSSNSQVLSIHSSSRSHGRKTNQPRKVGRGGFPNPLLSLYDEGWTQLRKRYKSNNQELGEPLLERHGNGDGEEGNEKERKEARGKWGRNSSIKQISSEGFIRLAKLEVSPPILFLFCMQTDN